MSSPNSTPSLRTSSLDSLLPESDVGWNNGKGIKWSDEYITNAFPRTFHSCSLLQNQALIYGGKNNKIIMDDLISFQFNTGKWLPSIQNLGAPPPPLYLHSSAVVGNNLYVIGGYSDGKKINENIYSLDLTKGSYVWTKLANNTTGPRCCGHICHSIGTSIIVFGGKTHKSTLSNDLWVYSTETNTWEKKKTSRAAPTPRWKHCSYLNSSGQLYVFGGECDQKTLSNELYVLDTDTWEWRHLDLHGPPSARKNSALIVISNVLYVIGGCISNDKTKQRYSDDIATVFFLNADYENKSPILTNTHDHAAGKWNKHFLINKDLLGAAGHTATCCIHETKKLITIFTACNRIHFLDAGFDLIDQYDRKNRGSKIFWRRTSKNKKAVISEYFPPLYVQDTAENLKEKYKSIMKFNTMSITTMRGMADDIFTRYIIDQNAKKKITITFEELVTLQVAMETERDRALKAKLQKDSQQAKYEQEVEKNLELVSQNKKLQQKLDEFQKLNKQMRSDLKILKSSVNNCSNSEDLTTLCESIESIETIVRSSSTVLGPRTQKKVMKSRRVSVPLADLNVTPVTRKRNLSFVNSSTLEKQTGIDQAVIDQHLQLIEALHVQNAKIDVTVSIKPARSTSRHLLIRKIDSTFQLPIDQTPSNAPAPTDEVLKRYTNIVNELIQTEENYVVDLFATIALFVVPLRDKLKIITPEESKILFSNIEEIAKNQKTMLSDLLAQRNLPPNQHTFPEIFTSFIPSVERVYSPYCANLLFARRLKNKLVEQNKDFKEFLVKVLNDPNSNKQDIKSFLIKPLQRLCKYPLLLKELQKHAPPGCADVSASLREMELVINRINDTMLACDMQEPILDIEDSILGKLKLSHPKRRFIEKADFVQYQTRGKRVRSSLCQFILLSDLILILEEHQERTKKKVNVLIGMIPLTNCVMDIIQDDDLIVKSQNLSADNLFAVRLNTYTASGEETKFVIGCENPQEVSYWCENIGKQIAIVAELQEQANSQCT